MHCEVPAPNYSTKSDEWVSCSAFCPGTSSERPEDHNASGLRSSPEAFSSATTVSSRMHPLMSKGLAWALLKRTRAPEQKLEACELNGRVVMIVVLAAFSARSEGQRIL
ncbi:hypothetical protein BDA96_10G116500 [Sorghum bicolor]|uniref:Uncharacterized protein n=1 Tax=Sorghum bicolor TaxID=4558 RepID=A0A921Q3D2_SORBI|nr:hypothetical protein BDA96_10G116500 [Sorghum bicolor]